MKSLVLMVAGILCLSNFALATSLAPNPATDRVEVAPGMFAITNSEAFEYVCNLETSEGGTKVQYKTFLDVDFAEGNGYRFAVGFMGGIRVAGMLAAEVPVLSVTKARCPGLCLKMTVKSDEDGTTDEVEFNENPITNVISMTAQEDGKMQVVGTCMKNEVP